MYGHVNKVENMINIGGGLQRKVHFNVCLLRIVPPLRPLWKVVTEPNQCLYERRGWNGRKNADQQPGCCFIHHGSDSAMPAFCIKLYTPVLSSFYVKAATVKTFNDCMKKGFHHFRFSPNSGTQYWNLSKLLST